MAFPTPAVPATATAVVNTTGQWAVATVTGGTVQSIVVTPQTPVPFSTPAVPATTVTATNTLQNPVAVAIAANGATISAINVNGSSQGTSVLPWYVVPAGGTIAIAYTVATPTWAWTPVLAGVSGNPVSSPYSVPLFPGCSITLAFTGGAPTWAWTNPLAEGYTPSPSAMNQLAEASGYNPYTLLPWAQHAALAQTGLATAVSN